MDQCSMSRDIVRCPCTKYHPQELFRGMPALRMDHHAVECVDRTRHDDAGHLRIAESAATNTSPEAIRDFDPLEWTYHGS